jgi:hypothetical protein
VRFHSNDCSGSKCTNCYARGDEEANARLDSRRSRGTNTLVGYLRRVSHRPSTSSALGASPPSGSEPISRSLISTLSRDASPPQICVRRRSMKSWGLRRDFRREKMRILGVRCERFGRRGWRKLGSGLRSDGGQRRIASEAAMSPVFFRRFSRRCTSPQIDHVGSTDLVQESGARLRVGVMRVRGCGAGGGDERREAPIAARRQGAIETFAFDVGGCRAEGRGATVNSSGAPAEAADPSSSASGGLARDDNQREMERRGLLRCAQNHKRGALRRGVQSQPFVKCAKDAPRPCPE